MVVVQVESKFHELQVGVLVGIVCGFLLGGGGDDDYDVWVESRETMAWSCGANARLYPCRGCIVHSNTCKVKL